MIVFMLAMALLALFVGSMAFVTGPVGLTLAAVITGWLVIYAARGLHARKVQEAEHRG
jgi:uncharacterized membrane protein